MITFKPSAKKSGDRYIKKALIDENSSGGDDIKIGIRNDLLSRKAINTLII